MNDIISLVLTAIADIIVAIVVTKLCIKISEKNKQKQHVAWNDHLVDEFFKEREELFNKIDKLEKENKNLSNLYNEVSKAKEIKEKLLLRIQNIIVSANEAYSEWNRECTRDEIISINNEFLISYDPTIIQMLHQLNTAVSDEFTYEIELENIEKIYDKYK